MISSSSSSSSAAPAAAAAGSVVSDNLLRLVRPLMTQRDDAAAAPSAASAASASVPQRAPCGCKGVKARRQQFIEQNSFPRGASAASAIPLSAAPSAVAGSKPAAGKNCAHCRSPLSDLCIMCDSSHHAPASTTPARPPLFTDDGEGGDMSDDEHEHAAPHATVSGAMGMESPQPAAASSDCTLVQGACGHSFHSHCFKTCPCTHSAIADSLCPFSAQTFFSLFCLFFALRQGSFSLTRISV